MSPASYDLAVIGSGPGGHAAALTAARRGLRVCLIERERVGGVCLNVGCIPTKAMVAVADFVRRLRHAESMGVSLRGYTIDYAAIISRTERIVTGLRQGMIDLLRRERVELITGSAAFDNPTRLLVTREKETIPVNVERVVIATGGRPSPGPWAFDEQRLVSYRGLLSLTTLPKSLLIIGGGVIGCEFASCLSVFGTKVTIVEQQPTLLPGEDPDAVRWLVRRLESEGVVLLTGRTVESLTSSATGVTAVLSDRARVEAERCVIAIGQRPNIEGLNLAAALVASGRGVVVDSTWRTSQPKISAIGDCLDGHGLAHWASAEGTLAVRHQLGDLVGTLSPQDVPKCIFTEPGIARIGPLASEIEGVKVSRFSFGALGKSHCDGETDGFVKLLVDPATDRVRGATIVGAHAATLIHQVVVAIRQGITARQLAGTITAHPTLPEAITEAAASLYGESLAVASRAGVGPVKAAAG